MFDEHDELNKRFSSMPKPPFPNALKEQILAEAGRMRQGGRKRRSIRSLVASIGAMGVACVLVWAVWSIVGRLAVIQSPTTASHPQEHTVSSVVGLQTAPVSVTIESDHASGAADGTVKATLTNVGTEVIHSRDIIGLLTFEQGNQPDMLVNAAWAGFVNGPNQPLLPGQSVQWSFRPLGVPTDASGHFLGKVNLLFLKTGTVSPRQADLVWQKAPVQVGAVTATPRKDWNGGRSFSVQATLTNQGAAPVTLSSLMAIVWFGGDGDWTHPDAVRFLTRVTAVDGESTVASGRTVTVHCSLIGPASLDVTRTAVHLMLIWQ